MLRNRRRQRRLAMINMAYRPDIHMWLGPRKLFLSHLPNPPFERVTDKQL